MAAKSEAEKSRENLSSLEEGIDKEEKGRAVVVPTHRLGAEHRQRRRDELSPEIKAKPQPYLTRKLGFAP